MCDAPKTSEPLCPYYDTSAAAVYWTFSLVGITEGLLITLPSTTRDRRALQRPLVSCRYICFPTIAAGAEFLANPHVTVCIQQQRGSVRRETGTLAEPRPPLGCLVQQSRTLFFRCGKVPFRFESIWTFPRKTRRAHPVHSSFTHTRRSNVHHLRLIFTGITTRAWLDVAATYHKRIQAVLVARREELSKFKLFTGMRVFGKNNGRRW